MLALLPAGLDTGCALQIHIPFHGQRIIDESSRSNHGPNGKSFLGDLDRMILLGTPSHGEVDGCVSNVGN